MSRHLERGLVLLDLRRIKEAAREFIAAGHNGDDRATALAMLAYTQLQDDRRDAAGNSIRQALAIEPTHAMGQCAAAMLAMMERRHKDARDINTGLLADHPNNTWILTQGAWNEFRLGDLAASRRIAEHALSLDPQSEPLIQLLMFVTSEMDDAETAAEFAERLLTLNPNRAEPHALLALRHLNERRFSEAQRFIREALRLDPVNPYVVRTEMRISAANNWLLRSFNRFFTTPSLLLGAIILPLTLYWGLVRLNFAPSIEFVWRLCNPLCVACVLAWLIMVKVTFLEFSLTALTPRWRRLLFDRENAGKVLKTGHFYVGSMAALVLEIINGGGEWLGLAVLQLFLCGSCTVAGLIMPHRQTALFAAGTLALIGAWLVIVCPLVPAAELTSLFICANIAMIAVCIKLGGTLLKNQPTAHVPPPLPR